MTKEQQWLSKKYIAYKALTNVWFVAAVWLYFYRLFMTDQQIGILDGLAFAIGVLAEVPSGALADKFGRDRIVRLGQILIGGGLLFQAIGGDFMIIFAGQAVMCIGLAFVSGADEALFFERLNFKRSSTQWRKLVTRGSQVALIVTLIATVIGGWLHTVDPRLPWIFTGLAFMLATVLIWPVKDTRPRKQRQKFLPEIKSYLFDIKTGFAQFWRPSLRIYVPLIVTAQGLFYAADAGLLRIVLLDRFHFDPFWGSVAVASSSLITVGILAYINKNADSMSEKKLLVTIGLVAASSLLLSVANIGLWGYVVILALYAGKHVLQPFMSEILNNRAPEDQRATVLSVASFFQSLPYVLLGPIIGYLNTIGQLQYFLIAWAILIFGAVALYVSVRRRDQKVVLADS